MGGFTVVKNGGDLIWCATDGSSTYYVGQIVSYIAASKANINGTVKPLAVPAGAADLTNYQVPAGVVVSINDGSSAQQYNATYGQYRAGVTAQADQLARAYQGAEGMYIKGDPQVMVQVQEIFPHTYLRGPIYNAAYGTAPTLLTVSATTDSDGMVSANTTTNACDFTNVTLMGTIYCRSGKNAGVYRVSKDTSTTAPTVTTAFPYDIAVGDTFVRVPIKQGSSTAYIDGPGLWIDCSKNPVAAATTLFHIIVTKLDLEKAGYETAEFRFGGDHFCAFRA